jgi:hypothetical protein
MLTSEFSTPKLDGFVKSHMKSPLAPLYERGEPSHPPFIKGGPRGILKLSTRFHHSIKVEIFLFNAKSNFSECINK